MLRLAQEAQQSGHREALAAHDVWAAQGRRQREQLPKDRSCESSAAIAQRWFHQAMSSYTALRMTMRIADKLAA